ncbi:MAG: radical SAM family heme chaperone HemW [Bacteroidota bacterium]
MAALYVHIPFCRHLCPYCDFYSVEAAGAEDAFLRALCREIALRGDRAGGEHLDSVFLGGGTPSLLTPDQVSMVLAEVRRSWPVDPCAEITLETNPGTVDRAKLAALRETGVNRLSIGVQSFDDGELRFLGRIHTARDAAECLASAREAGFGNISLDLLYAIPGQTEPGWEKTLRTAVSLAPAHISAYGLVVEEGTPLWEAVRRGDVRPAAEEQEARLFERTMELLEAEGYEHYEVSNYALPGHACRHNLTYWGHGNYIGVGPSAHSFWRDARGLVPPRRWANVADGAAYTDRIRQAGSAVEFEEELTPGMLLTESLFLALRSRGVEEEALRRAGRTEGGGLPGLLEDLIGKGLVRREGGRIRLTRAGFLLCDEITSRILSC